MRKINIKVKMLAGFLSLFIRAVASVFLHRPSNMAILKGNNMTMTCDPNVNTNPINWYHSPVWNINTTPPVLPVNKGASANKDFSEFSLGGIPPGQSLFLNYAQLKHAGLYKCASKGETATAELIVLESEPNCSMTANAVSVPTQFRLVCSLVYNGNWVPVMEWQQQQPHGDELANIASNNELITERDDKRMTSSLNITSNYSMHPFKYSCQTYFSNSSFKHAAATSATNIPLYQYNWMSPTIHIIIPVNGTDFSTSITPERPSATTDESAAQHKSLTFISTALVIVSIIVSSVSLAVVLMKKKQKSRVNPTAEKRSDSDSFSDRSLSVYANPRVASSASGPMVPEQDMISVTKRNLKVVGADGTVYTEMNHITSVQELRIVPSPPAYPPLFSKSIYARIDHTTQPPPLPPPLQDW